MNTEEPAGIHLLWFPSVLFMLNHLILNMCITDKARRRSPPKEALKTSRPDWGYFFFYELLEIMSSLTDTSSVRCPAKQTMLTIKLADVSSKTKYTRWRTPYSRRIYSETVTQVLKLCQNLLRYMLIFTTYIKFIFWK